VEIQKKKNLPQGGGHAMTLLDLKKAKIKHSDTLKKKKKKKKKNYGRAGVGERV
jgi:hypothetical protein